MNIFQKLTDFIFNKTNVSNTHTSAAVPNQLIRKMIYVGWDEQDNDYCMSCVTIQRLCPICRANNAEIKALEIPWEK